MIKLQLQGAFNGEMAIRTLKVESPQHARAAAQWVVYFVKSAIVSRKFNLAPARGRWAKRKHGDTPLVDTSQYVASLQVRRYLDGYTAGPADKFVSRAIALEYGTRRYPPRPHWRPAADRVARELPRILEKLQLQKKLAQSMRGK